MTASVDAVPETAAERAPSTAGRGHVAGVDGVRAVAALLVVLVHVGVVTGLTFRSGTAGPYLARGEVGVSVFFVLSGFLLYRPFVAAALAGSPAPATGRYLLRRGLRILPLYWLALAATYAFEGWSATGGVGGVAAHALFLQVYSSHWVYRGVTQAWTLCDEVVFYLALPLWAAGLRRLHARARDQGSALRRELVALVVLWAVGLAFRTWVGAAPTGATETARFWTASWLDHFAVGMALAAVSARAAQRGSLPRALRWTAQGGGDVVCWALAAGAFWLVSQHVGLSRLPVFREPTGRDLVGHLLYAAFALLVVLPVALPVAVGARGRGPVRRLLRTRVLAALGLVSYGVYLWHQLVNAALQRWVPSWRPFASPFPQFLAAVLGATLVLAVLSHLVVERPAMDLGRRRRRGGAAPVEQPR